MEKKDKKKKRYYSGQQKVIGKGKHSFKTIAFGSSGILCTSDKFHQKFCGMEARTILEEHFQLKFGKFEVKDNCIEVTNTNDEASISELLSKEIAEAKKDAKSSSSTRLWEFTDTKCNGVEFLELHPKAHQMMKGQPLSTFLTSLFTSSPPQSRHIRRMIPLEDVFQANASNIKAEVKKLAYQTVFDIVQSNGLFSYKLEVFSFFLISYSFLLSFPCISLRVATIPRLTLIQLCNPYVNLSNQSLIL